MLEKESFLDPASVEKNLNPAYHLALMPELRQVVEYALTLFMESNLLAPEIGTHRIEEEVISSVSELWNLSNGSGIITAGGTESNILALYAARNLAKNVGKGASVILPSTAHPSFYKGCDWLGLQPVTVPVDSDFRVSPGKVQDAIRPDTIAIVATCGTFPWGTVDPIDEIGKISEERSIYFHVDGAYGGMILPWLEQGGVVNVSKFDFRVGGVSSISTDPHKMGFSIIPDGVIIFRNHEYRELASWRGMGVSREYSPTGFLGSRPGANVAIIWALFNYLGKQGYIELTKKSMDLTSRLVKDVLNIPNLECAAVPEINLTSIISKSVSMEKVKANLRKKGWFMYFQLDGTPMTYENTLTIGLSPRHEKMYDLLMHDLNDAAKGLSM